MQRRPGGVAIEPLLVAAVFAALALRMLRLIDEHAVDVLYFDQWGLYGAFYTDASWWETFRWQHGPHRQGAGFLLTRLVAEASGWNARADAFLVGAVLCAAAAMALLLVRRLFGRTSPADVAIPLICFTPAQYQIFVHTPNVSHGAMPLLLLVLSALAWTLEDERRRLAAVVVLNFLLVHTGFGFFAGAVTPALLVVECVRAGRERGAAGTWLPGLALLATIASAAAFFPGYDTTRAARAGVAQPLDPRFWQFVALCFANVLGIRGSGTLPTLAGAAAALASLVVGAYHALRLARGPGEGRAASSTIALLCAFALLFAVGTAAGRLGRGLEWAQSSRYLPLLAPALLGIYVHLRTLRPGPARRALLAAVCAALVVACVPVRAVDARIMERLAGGKRAWVEAYLATEDVGAANRLAGRSIYPHAPERAQLPEKLAHMKEHRLGFYRDRDP